MTTAPDVSVLINNYNYGRFLGDAIDSALGQTDVSAEVIVVDDGSTDNSRDVITRYGERVRSHFQPNMGQAVAINAGAAMARAPFLAFLDADDWWRPDKLRTVLNVFRTDPEAGIVYHRLQPMFSGGGPAFAPIPRSLCQGEIAKRLVRSGGRWPFPMTSSLTVSRDLWNEAGDIPADFKISADAWIAGIFPFIAPVRAIAEPLGFYRIHENSWYRPHDDAEMLARRMAHWEATVRVTNAFLDSRGSSERVWLRDHFEHSVALTRLGRPGAPGVLALAWRGLIDQGEPSVVRRVRDTVFALYALRRDRKLNKTERATW